jgi:adenylate kinase family enzyme
MRKVVVLASASGNGKTTLGKALAERMRVPFVELDELNHGPNWTEATADELRAKVEPIVATEAWVIDGGYQGKLGDLVVRQADLVVWLDLPVRVWLPRLWRRTRRRIHGDEPLWHDNKESWRTALVGWNSLFVFALRGHFRKRRDYPARLAPFHVVRLRTAREVERFLEQAR